MSSAQFVGILYTYESQAEILSYFIVLDREIVCMPEAATRRERGHRPKRRERDKIVCGEVRLL